MTISDYYLFVYTNMRLFLKRIKVWLTFLAVQGERVTKGSFFKFCQLPHRPAQLPKQRVQLRQQRRQLAQQQAQPKNLQHLLTWRIVMTTDWLIKFHPLHRHQHLNQAGIDLNQQTFFSLVPLTLPQTRYTLPSSCETQRQKSCQLGQMCHTITY